MQRICNRLFTDKFSSGTKLSPCMHLGIFGSREIIKAFREHSTPKQKNRRIQDKIISWREFFHHLSSYSAEPPAYEYLPEWSCENLAKHAHERSDSTTPTLEKIIHGETIEKTNRKVNRVVMPNDI